MSTLVATLRREVAAARGRGRKETYALALWGLVPTVVLVWEATLMLGRPNRFAVDVRDAYYVAGYRLLHGGNPYGWTHHQIYSGFAFVYPAFSALFFAPFALIAVGAAGVLFTLVCIAVTPLTLWVLRVRDWRVYVVALLWLPVFSAWQTANETMLLVFITALVWRYRGNPVVAGALTAASISLKPVMWPLALWLLATRRWRAAAYSLATGLLINLVSWSVVGFGKVGGYLSDAALDSRHAWRAGYGVTAAFGHLGLGRSFGDVMTAVVCATLLVAITYVAFVKHRERQAMSLTIVLALAASPLLWMHYFALLLVPLALERPRIGLLWWLPLLMWICPAAGHVDSWQEALVWLVAGTVLVSTTVTSPGCATRGFQ